MELITGGLCSAWGHGDVLGVSWGCPGVSSPTQSLLYPHSSGDDGKETPGPWGCWGPGASAVRGERGGRVPGLPGQIFAQAVKTEQILLITAHQLPGGCSQHPVCHGRGAGTRSGRCPPCRDLKHRGHRGHPALRIPTAPALWGEQQHPGPPSDSPKTSGAAHPARPCMAGAVPALPGSLRALRSISNSANGL